MAALSDMRLLLEEERIIREMMLKLNDQLNRLKVEELALISKSRDDKISNATACVSGSSNHQSPFIDVKSEKDDENVNSSFLNLCVNLPNASHLQETSTVEEDDSDNEDISQNRESCQGELAYFLVDSGNF